MRDHSRCVVEMSPQWERHTCPPCPHGLVRGYDLALTDSLKENDNQRRLKLGVVDSMSCSDSYHAAAMAQR